MWQQIRTIAWAQLRITRNHLPRTGAGSVITGLVSLLWYGLFGVLAFAIAGFLSQASLTQIRYWLPRGLLGAFLFWQVVPLFTLTGGWSLHLKKLQIYPVSTGALFTIEVILRITTAFEMLLVLTGASIGLMRNQGVPPFAPLCLFLFVPFNLLFALALRELLIHSFRNKRFREIFSIALISLSTLPSFFVHTRLHRQVNRAIAAMADLPGTPWHAAASLSYGSSLDVSLMALALWTCAMYLLARWQFAHSLRDEDLIRGGTTSTTSPRQNGGFLAGVLEFPNRLFADPLAALIEKEIRSLLRMPRFRIVFGMACFFSIIVFVPLAFESTGTHFMRENFLMVVSLYGLLLLSDTLLWNIFGLDRGAAQIYFVAPVNLKAVFRAKNITAVLFVLTQNLVVFLVAILFRFPITPLSVATSLSASAVVGLFLLAVGNLSSVSIPRPIDPTQTLRKQAGGKIQIWLAGCALGSYLLVGFAFLARWAIQRDWALFAVFTLEFALGLVVFHIAQDSALEHALRQRENLVDTLSKGASQLAL